jgi:gluconolactonase
LYIADSGKKIWMRYRVQPDGSVTDGALFLDASHDSTPGEPDSIRVDKKGNLYGAGPGRVWIVSPEGKHLGTIKVPETVTNVAWATKMARRSTLRPAPVCYRIKLKVPGVKT